MKLSHKINLFLAAALGGLVLVLPAFSQTTVCNVDVRVIDIDDVSRNIDGASARIENLDTKRSQTAVVRNGLLRFTALEEADNYQLTITRRGFKRTIQNRVIRCVPLVDDAVRTLGYLKKGSSKQTYKVERPVATAFKIGVVDEPVKEAQIASSEGTAPPSADPPSPFASSRKKISIISKGVVNGSAVYLAKPEYPPTAKAVGAAGAVSVQVTINEEGYVISAIATSGHPLLRGVSVEAAKASIFKPTLLEGVPVKVSGIVVYNFQ